VARMTHNEPTQKPARYIDGCQMCDDLYARYGLGIPFAPNHKPSVRCQSGSRPHCTLVARHCPDCDGTGRHTFTIEVACEACGDRHDHPIGNSSGGATFRVSVVPDMVLPIYDHDELLDGAVSLPRDWAPHIDIMGGEPLLCTRCEKYSEDWDEDRITLPPAAAPGQYAVKVQLHQIGENQ